MEEQTKINEKIRDTYSFVKYTERIKDIDSLSYAMAKEAWLIAIVEGCDFMINSPASNRQELKKKFVTQDTKMRRKIYTSICSQGPVEREKWLFPWE